MADTKKYIKKIQLPGQTEPYSVYDEEAIHNIEDLGLASALVFKGTKATEAEVLAVTGAKIGDVWLAQDTSQEFVCIKIVGSTADSTAWEKLGSLYDAASSTHTHDVTVTGTNSTSSVTGSVTVPTVSKTTKYLKATATKGSVTAPKDNVLGEATSFTTTVGSTTSKIKATASGTAVASNGTASVISALGTPTTANAITGFGTHSTDSVLGSSTTFTASPTVTKTNIKATASGTALSTGNADFVKSYPGVTSKLVTTSIKGVAGTTTVPGSVSATAGSAASWSATVDANGVLSFSWTANTPTSVTVGANKTVATANSSATTVATGALSSTGGGSIVMTGLGTATTGKALTSASVSTQPTIALSTGATAGTGVVSVATDVPSVEVSTNSDDNVNAITALGTPTTASAITGFGSHTTKSVLTGVKVSAQPTIKLEVDNNATANYVEVVTDVEESAATTAGNNDIVSAVTGVTVGNPSVTLSSSESTSTGAVTYVEDVTTGTTSANLQNGKAAAQKWTQASGVTGQPK